MSFQYDKLMTVEDIKECVGDYAFWHTEYSGEGTTLPDNLYVSRLLLEENYLDSDAFLIVFGDGQGSHYLPNGNKIYRVYYFLSPESAVPAIATDLSIAGHMVENDIVILTFTITNLFINQGAAISNFSASTMLHTGSYNGVVQQIYPLQGTTTLPANSEISTQAFEFTIPTGYTGASLYFDTPSYPTYYGTFGEMQVQREGRWSSLSTLSNIRSSVLLKSPTITVSASTSTLAAGGTATITLRITNPNNYAGSGYSVWTTNTNGGNEYSVTTGLSKNRTITKTYTFTAPSPSAQTIVTITPHISGGTMDGCYRTCLTGITGAPCTIIVAAAPAKYFPFQIIDGDTILSKSDFESVAIDTGSLSLTLNPAGGGSPETFPYSQWKTLTSGSATYWYVETRTMSAITASGVTASGDCDELVFDYSTKYSSGSYANWGDRNFTLATANTVACFTSISYGYIHSARGVTCAQECNADCIVALAYNSSNNGIYLRAYPNPASPNSATTKAFLYTSFTAQTTTTSYTLSNFEISIYLTYQNSLYYPSITNRTRNISFVLNRNICTSAQTGCRYNFSVSGATFNNNGNANLNSCSSRSGGTPMVDSQSSNWTSAGYILTPQDFMHGDGSSTYGAGYISQITVRSANTSNSYVTLSPTSPGFSLGGKTFQFGFVDPTLYQMLTNDESSQFPKVWCSDWPAWQFPCDQDNGAIT